MSRLRSEIVLVSSNSRPGRSRPATSITVNWLDSALSTSTSGATVKAPSRPRLLAPLRHQRAEPDLALEQLLDGLGDAPRAAQLVLVLLELARQQERVEREAVARGRDVRARDVGAGGRAGAGKQRQQARMVGREQRQLGDGRERVGCEVAGELLAGASARADQLGVLHRLARVGPEPVVGIVPVDEAFHLLRRPIGDGGAEGRLGRGDAIAARRAACGRPPPPARSRSRARAAAGPSSRSRCRARRRGCRPPSAPAAASGAPDSARCWRSRGWSWGRRCRG